MGCAVRTPAGRHTEWRDWTTGKLVGSEYYPRGEETEENAKPSTDELEDSKELKKRGRHCTHSSRRTYRLQNAEGKP